MIFLFFPCPRNSLSSPTGGPGACSQQPFQLTIHRLGFIGRNGLTGVGNDEDMMSRMIRGALQVGNADVPVTCTGDLRCCPPNTPLPALSATPAHLSFVLLFLF